MSFLRHEKIYQFDGLKRESNCSFNSLTDHRSDESSTGYSFMSCSPAELTSASPVLQSFSLNLAAVKPPAANRNCPYFSLSQSRGPLHPVPPFNFPECGSYSIDVGFEPELMPRPCILECENCVDLLSPEIVA